jgi:hypothetical protein
VRSPLTRVPALWLLSCWRVPWPSLKVSDCREGRGGRPAVRQGRDTPARLPGVGGQHRGRTRGWKGVGRGVRGLETKNLALLDGLLNHQRIRQNSHSSRERPKNKRCLTAR